MRLRDVTFEDFFMPQVYTCGPRGVFISGKNDMEGPEGGGERIQLHLPSACDTALAARPNHRLHFLGSIQWGANFLPPFPPRLLAPGKYLSVGSL